MEIWKDKSRDNAAKIISELTKDRTEPGFGLSMRFFIMLRELTLSLKNNSRAKRVTLILQIMQGAGKFSIEDFEKLYLSNLTDYKLNKSGQYNIFLPFNITLSDDIPRKCTLKILDKELVFLKSPVAIKRLNKDRLQAILTNYADNRHIPTPKPPNFITISTNSSSADDAWHSIEPAYDAFRGLLELTLGLGSWKIGGETSTRSIVSHPEFVIIQDPDKKLEIRTFLTDKNKDKILSTLSKHEYNALKQNSRIIKSNAKPGSTLYLISDCLRLYVQAMDASLPYTCFLGFWQLAETLTHAEKSGGSSAEVKSRLEWHINNSESFGVSVKNVLDYYATRRNDIVHKGISTGISGDDVNIIKNFCEIVFLWLIDNHDKLPSVESLEQFYKLRSSNNAQLEAIRHSIKFVDYTRSQK